MRQIYNYISEKLHLSKDTKVNANKVELVLQFVEEYMDYDQLRILKKWLDKHKENNFDVFANVKLENVDSIDKKYEQIEYSKEKSKEILDRTKNKSWRLIKRDDERKCTIGYMEDIFFIEFPYNKSRFQYWGTIYITYKHKDYIWKTY